MILRFCRSSAHSFARSNGFRYTLAKFATSTSIKTVPLFEVGEGISEASIVNWRVKEGDTVEKGTVLCDVETDKATVEVSSPFSGKVQKLLVPVGEQVAVGRPLVNVIADESAKLRSHKWNQADNLEGVPATAKSMGASSRRKQFSSLMDAVVYLETTASSSVTSDARPKPERKRLFGLLRLAQGEQATVWSLDGEGRIEKGPKQVLLSGETFELCSHFTAGVNEYLSIVYSDGRVEHANGPTEAWFNPMVHQSISVRKALQLNSNEAIVVYRKPKNPSESAERRITHGPDIYFPQPSEWMHEFAWHGATQKFRFYQLRTLPDHIPFTIDHVRTADDALIVLKVAVFFKLQDINRFLDNTRDPLQDFEVSVSADLIRFAATTTFDKLKQASEDLNKLALYPTLVERAKNIGFEVFKVVFRGFSATSGLKLAHESGLMKRTELLLRKEKILQDQDNLDAKERHKAKQLTRQLEMQTEESKHELRLGDIKHENSLSDKKAKALLELERVQSVNNTSLEYYKRLKSLGIDLSDYLVAKEKVSISPTSSTSHSS